MDNSGQKNHLNDGRDACNDAGGHCASDPVAVTMGQLPKPLPDCRRVRG
jgi:hypothetical protein